jgi:hypothetical protein
VLVVEVDVLLSELPFSLDPLLLLAVAVLLPEERESVR